MFYKPRHRSINCLFHAKMSSPFADSKYITTIDNLRDILQKCTLCNKLTLNGSLIMPCDKLSTIKLPNNKQKKYFLIIHVPSRSESNNFLGHWLGCCINTQTKQCLLVDSANVVPSQTGTMHYISNFCNANRLTLLNFNLMFQDKSNVLCGQYQLYICSIFSKRSLRQTLNLKYMLQKYNLKKLAYFIIQQVERHFHIKF